MKDNFDVKNPIGLALASVVKLLNKDRYVVGNGLILSPTLLTVPTSLVPTREAIS
jgi:hypothetical protein